MIIYMCICALIINLVTNNLVCAYTVDDGQKS